LNSLPVTSVDSLDPDGYLAVRAERQYLRVRGDIGSLGSSEGGWDCSVGESSDMGVNMRGSLDMGSTCDTFSTYDTENTYSTYATQSTSGSRALPPPYSPLSLIRKNRSEDHLPLIRDDVPPPPPAVDPFRGSVSPLGMCTSPKRFFVPKRYTYICIYVYIYIYVLMDLRVNIYVHVCILAYFFT
jgi:hypothetical protein